MLASISIGRFQIGNGSRASKDSGQAFTLTESESRGLASFALTSDLTLVLQCGGHRHKHGSLD
jgi:hypothetical protein